MNLRTKNTLLKPGDLDETWAFQFYTGCPALSGQDEKIKSPFARDSDPSFSIYKSKQSPDARYRWHCFATGLKGDIFDLIARIKSTDPNVPLDRNTVFKIIKTDFEAVGYTHVPVQQMVNTKGRVHQWELRNWTDNDVQWWAQWGINMEMLIEYNVAPMGEWMMHKTINNEKKVMIFNNPLAYGYLTDKGELTKIYQPGMKGAKFIKVMEYHLQGSDQLKFKSEELIIQSSLKDGLSFRGMFPEYEFVAPDSENILIRKNDLELLREKYKRIRTLFDYDKAGITAAGKYLEQHGIEPIVFTMAKDVADSVRDNGQILTQINLSSLL